MVVFLAEFIKLAFSVSAYVHTHAGYPGNVWGVIRAELEDAAAERRYLRFAVPALIYLIENHLRFVVLSRLASPITWVVFSHVEIPIVAALSFYLLRRKLRRNQWIAVFLLLDGVMAAEIALCHAKGDGDPSHPSCDSFAAYPVVALSLVLLGATSPRSPASPPSSCTKSTSRRPFTTKRAAVRVRSVGERGDRHVFLFWNASVEDGGEGEGDDGPAPAVARGSAPDLVRHLTLMLDRLAAIMKHLSNIAKVFNSAAGMVVVTIMSMAFLGTKTLPFSSPRR